MVVSSPAYASPERALGERRQGIRSDLFSLGVTWYEALVGERAFLGANPVSVITEVATRDLLYDRLATAPVPRAGIAILRMLTQREPERRYATPLDLLGDVDAVTLGRPPPLASAVARTGLIAARKPARSFWPVMLVGAVLLAVTVVFANWAQQSQAPAEALVDAPTAAPVPAPIGLPTAALASPTADSVHAAPPGAAVDLLTAIGSAQGPVPDSRSMRLPAR